jgi:ankyrin repeat protein
MILAAGKGDTVAVKELLDQGANVNAKEKDGRTAIMDAAYNGHADTVKLLLDRGADLSLKKTDGADAMALSGNHKDIVELFKTVDVVVAAAGTGDNEKLKDLLAKGAPLNARDRSGHTALTEAAWNGHTDTIKLLLEKGADPNIRKADGATAVALASGQKHQDIVDILNEAITRGPQAGASPVAAANKTSTSPSPVPSKK